MSISEQFVKLQTANSNVPLQQLVGELCKCQFHHVPNHTVHVIDVKILLQDIYHLEVIILNQLL